MPETICDSEYLLEAVRISPAVFSRLGQLITQELGILMPESKAPMIQSRLSRRVRALGLPSLEEYCDYLFSSDQAEEERIHFVNAVTTNKTDFFREPQHFKYLREIALPEMQNAGQTALGGRMFTVWSAACSSGEEPYTLAMVLSEYAAGRPGTDFRILATDVSTQVLQKAKDGIYSRPQIAPIPQKLCRKYLLHGKGEHHSQLRMKPALRQRVSFHYLNLMDDSYGVREMFDVIFCRNVLIYFDRPTQQAVIQKLCRHLIPGGYLFVSHSESLHGLDLPLTSLGSSCYRKPAE